MKNNILFLLLSVLNISIAQAEIADPLEGLNRKIFWFNDHLDYHILEPIAESYHENLPNEFRNSVFNFFDNLKYPVYLVSDLVQLKFGQACRHTTRFAINTTVGIGGFFDPAKDWGFESQVEDFGAALGYHGVDDGFYLVIPFLGSSSARDVFSLAVDITLSPIFHIVDLNINPRIANSLTVGFAATNIISSRERFLREKTIVSDHYLYSRAKYKEERDKVIYNLMDETD